MSKLALTSTSLPLSLVARGKVRDVYDAGITDGPHQGALLFVATDRISAFDIILENVSLSLMFMKDWSSNSLSFRSVLQGIPGKGKLLHALSTFWFQLLTPSIIESHIIATEFNEFPAALQEKLKAVRDQVEGRSMLVKRAEVVPIEAIVRGYITGSGWKEYSKTGTVHGISLQQGLVESQEIPGGPLFTPSTKADQGQHDENIHPDKGETFFYSRFKRSVKVLKVDCFS
jgi:phosphoribosylaminoimidazole-succinocarboxamide synthase